MVDDLHWMQHALSLARRAEEQGEVPIGAVLVQQNELISEGWNQPIALHDPTAHAEIIAMRQGGFKLQNYRLLNTTLYVTLEPCLMCVGAMLHARISRLVFGAYDPKVGATTQLITKPSLKIEGGVMSEECGSLLKRFFSDKRA